MGLVLYRRKHREYLYVLHRSCRLQTSVRLDRDLYGNPYVSLTSTGIMNFREGYAWNGANFCPKVKELVKPSLKHDGSYQLIEDGLLPHTYRGAVDRELRQDVANCGTWIRLLAWPVYLGARLFGGLSIRYNMYKNQRSEHVFIAD